MTEPPFELQQAYVDEMVAHARDEAPNECCGILAGKDSRVQNLYRAVNAEASPYRYNVDTHDLLRIYRECEDKGWDFLAIYHSHTSTEAYPSPTDVSQATLADGQAAWPEAAYIIVSLLDPERPDVRAFRIAEGRVQELEFRAIPLNADSAPSL